MIILVCFYEVIMIKNRKLSILIFIFILFISAIFAVIQWRRHEEENRLAAIKQSMSKYEHDKNDLGISIKEARTSKAVRHTFGKPYYADDKKSQYVWLYLKISNSGTDAVQIKPEDFTLSIPGKGSVYYDYKTTSSMQKGMRPVKLKPSVMIINLLIFALPESKEYILLYNGSNGTIEKSVVVDWP